MVTGRTLLLADDSVTVQKVVDLTFADEGIQVISVSDGEQAIARLDTLMPDVVLADVFMPKYNGYQVCDYIKRQERLRHIPVMLLVGSFEPFDEAEARRVGADDYLTKPFQSIRQLVSKVGSLLGKKPAEELVTRELPPLSDPFGPERMTTDKIDRMTADTRPLDAATLDKAFPKKAAKVEQSFADLVAEDPPPVTTSAEIREGNKQPEIMTSSDQSPEPFRSYAPEVAEAATAAYASSHSKSTGGFARTAVADDALLDLGEVDPPSSAVEADDFILDLQDELTPRARRATDVQTVFEPTADAVTVAADDVLAAPLPVFASPSAAVPQLRGEESSPLDLADTGTSATPISGFDGTLSPEMVEVIARRVVELMSKDVVERVAWEVVPQLAELLIKQQLDSNK